LQHHAKVGQRLRSTAPLDQKLGKVEPQDKIIWSGFDRASKAVEEGIVHGLRLSPNG